jgi:SAM-dependent methyltransferase
MAPSTVSRAVSPRDKMYEADWPDVYFQIGEATLRAVRSALDLAEIVPQRVLDLPCGHGRGLRWLAANLDAEIVACDIDPDAVDFCAREFGVTPLRSHTEPEQIRLDGKFDLITCGSLLTHLDAPMWRRFLDVFVEHLSGVLVFSTGGRYFASSEVNIRPWLTARLGDEARADDLLSSYERTGFGYVDYLNHEGYGLARAKPAWVLSLLYDLPVRIVHFAEAGWDGYQDVYAVTPATDA